MTELVGRRFGGYSVLSLLGVGGMGVVYRARDERLGREVAIKMLPGELLADAEQRARFDREARVLAALNHPHIAAIYGIEECNGICALVLELVEGPTLAERLEKGALAVEETLTLAGQIAEALDAAHERGIVHRDLKPANVKIHGRSQAKLLDFGIATQAQAPAASDAVTGASALTGAGQILGTVDYMSPEQIRGESVDRRSDQFSFGIMLFEMLTGRNPFHRAAVAETLAAILRDRPRPIADLSPSTPPPLQWIVDRCLAKDPGDRYASTRDLARDLATLRTRLLEAPLTSAPKTRASMPKPRTPLVGREQDLAAVSALVLRDDVRLVTLTGVGGTGKTRLAIQVASEICSTFPGGTFFVPLSPVTDHGGVASAIVQVVGGRDSAHREPIETVQESLAVRGPVLIVLDNFEHVLEAAPLVTELLEACDQLKVLVTSRAVLRVYGEFDYAVPPLPVPSATRQISIAQLAACPSIALFLQRAAAVKPDFALTPEIAGAVSEICARLDGLPLAIELAAARVRTLTPAAMLQRLQSRFDLLTGGARDLPARHQTLRATVEWSFGLLTEDEQKLFRRLAVFVGGCTLEAAEAVCNAADDLKTSVLDAIESLVGKSLLQQVEPPRGETRFTMLQTIRDYALERFAASADDRITRQAQAAYCLVLAEEGPDQSTAEQTEAWLERCDLEHGNFRAALEWLRESNNAEWGLRLAAALFGFWRERAHYREGLERTNALLALPATSASQGARAQALEIAGHLASELGELDLGRTFYEEALNIHKALGNRVGIMSGINSLAAHELFKGNPEAATALFEECVQLSHETGDEGTIAQAMSNLAHGLKESGNVSKARALCEEALAILMRYPALMTNAAWLESRLGDLETDEGNPGGARAHYDRALALFEQLGDRVGLGRTKVDCGLMFSTEGHTDRARVMLTDALNAFHEMGNKRGLARALEGFALLAARAGQAERALRLAGAADAIRHSIGAAVYGADRLKLGRELDEARRTLGDAALAAEMDGWAMTVDAAVDVALAAS